jgi:hypothetical protein
VVDGPVVRAAGGLGAGAVGLGGAAVGLGGGAVAGAAGVADALGLGDRATVAVLVSGAGGFGGAVWSWHSVVGSSAGRPVRSTV